MISTTFRKIMLTLCVIPLYLFGLTCPPVSGTLGIGYDYFRSIPDGDWDGSVGGLASFNLGMPLYYGGAGLQFGSSYGIYDWAGRGSSPSNKQSDLQQQVFITCGIFRNTSCSSGWNGGLVYDWMWNERFGVFGVRTSFGQLRFQAGYLYRERNEFGIWGTADTDRSHVETSGIPLTFRGIAQINAYWKHRFENCAVTSLWAGLPYKRSLSFSTGRAGKFLVGGSFSVPLTGRYTLDGHASYMAPHSAPKGYRQRYYGANICLELKYALGDCHSRYNPYMPLGNNSLFITDTNVTY